MHYTNISIREDSKTGRDNGEKTVTTVQVTSTYCTVEGTSPYVSTSCKLPDKPIRSKH